MYLIANFIFSTIQIIEIIYAIAIVCESFQNMQNRQEKIGKPKGDLQVGKMKTKNKIRNIFPHFHFQLTDIAWVKKDKVKQSLTDVES